MGDDPAELQARIARLAGRINRHKTGEGPGETGYHGTGRTSACSAQTVLLRPMRKDHGHTWTPQRGTPYGVPRGRGYNARTATHRNRTLIVNSPPPGVKTRTDGQTSTASATDSDDSATLPGWVTKHDRHMQLINNTVYEKKTQERNKAIAETKRQKEVEREAREKAKVNEYVHAVAGNQGQGSVRPGNHPAHRIVINNIHFTVVDGGSKLIKEQDDANKSRPTPKRANVGGVTFLRSKNGNLYRSGMIKAKRRAGVKKIFQPCPVFSTTGSCPKGPQCRYVHDPEKVAICKDFLQTGECHAGDDCDLSHNPLPERVPACLHFLRGNCTNMDCRYAHVRTNPGAPVCLAFGKLGYCSKGASCADRHVHECPDYANKGICRNKKCRLPHVDRAGQLRKAAALKTDNEMDMDASSDVSSDEELDSDDVDSDEFEDNEEMIVPAEGNKHELSQQVDYVQL